MYCYNTVTFKLIIRKNSNLLSGVKNNNALIV